MKLSVAICTYNGARHLSAQLQSIAIQNRPPDELVVCDDGSDDGTSGLLYKFAAIAPFAMRVVENERNLGSTANFAKAIGLCAGDIIILADQDDVWHPDKLQRLEDAFAASPQLGLAFSDGELVDEQGHMLGQRLWQAVRFSRRERYDIQRGRGFDVLLRRNVVTGATLAFRSCWKHLILPIPEVGWVHDYWIALMVSAVSSIQMIDDPLIDYRCHADQQLGVLPRRTFAELWLRAQALSNSDICLAVAEHCTDALERLRGNSTNHQVCSAIEQLEAKIAHLRLRGNLPGQGWHRFAVVFDEIRHGRYFRYSLGLPSIVLDIFFKRSSRPMPRACTTRERVD
jgi:glycosyltransferase involved in cell wall biosynthesis